MRTGERAAVLPSVQIDVKRQMLRKRVMLYFLKSLTAALFRQRRRRPGPELGSSKYRLQRKAFVKWPHVKNAGSSTTRTVDGRVPERDDSSTTLNP